MTLTEARAKLEEGRKITEWDPEVSQAPFAANGARFIEVCSSGKKANEGELSQTFPSAGAAIDAWLKVAKAECDSFNAIEWRIFPEVDEMDGGWGVYSRFVAYNAPVAA